MSLKTLKPLKSLKSLKTLKSLIPNPLTTKDFIASHLNDDIRRLALTKAPEGVDLPFALQQIDGRQRAKAKLPSLAGNPDILFPVHLSIEQCSSEATARYKRKILEQKNRRFQTLIDLTGGFGIDFIHLSPFFQRAVYVERNPDLCDIARQNFQTLGLTNTEVQNTEAERFFHEPPKLRTPEASNPRIPEIKTPLVVFLDPARRDNAGKRTFAISDCTPDVIALIPAIKQLANSQENAADSLLLFLKLSPMLDWHKAVSDIQAAGMAVTQVHIVSVKNECKELLILSHPATAVETAAPRLFCTNDSTTTEITAAPETPAANEITAANAIPAAPAKPTTINGKEGILLLPNASIMKAGCWQFLMQRYNVRQADANSHIFFADREIADFPGQQFRILANCSLNKKELRAALQGIPRANISTRNFPLTAEALRKRLKLKDGGPHHIFATTVSTAITTLTPPKTPQNTPHRLFLCLPIA